MTEQAQDPEVAADMEGEEMDLVDEMEGEGEEMGDGEKEDEEDDGEDGNEKKWVKKEYIAQPYKSDFVEKTLEEVDAL
jgi:hypothetical protein